MDTSTEVAIVGPTGVIGRQLLQGLHDRGHPAERITLLGSERAQGEELDFGDESLEIEPLTDDAFKGMALVFFATPAQVSERWSPVARGAGARVVDLSAASVDDPQTPLLLPPHHAAEKPQAIDRRLGRVPSPMATALVHLVAPLVELGLDEVTGTGLMGASSEGQRGLDVLVEQTAGLLSGRAVESSTFPHRLALNLIPQVGVFAGTSTVEETRAVSEARRLLGARSPTTLALSLLQIPTFYGHVLSLTLRFGREASVESIRAALGGAPGVALLDDPAEGLYPMPMLATGAAGLQVGRLRAVPGAPEACILVAAFDNAGWGAAKVALDVAELLLQR